MNREDPYRDQAEKLRKKIDKKPELEAVTTEKSELPPRSRLHREKRQKNKWKLKHPIISGLALFFILLPITIYSMYHYLDMGKVNSSEKTSKTESGFETVGFDSNDGGKNTTIEEREPENEVEEDEDLDKSENEKPVHTSVPNQQVVDQAGSNDSNSKDDPSTPEIDEQKNEEENNQKEEKDSEVVVYHTVKPKETMYRIAMNYYQSPSGIEIIKKANNLKNENIQAGQVLVIPKKN